MIPMSPLQTSFDHGSTDVGYPQNREDVIVAIANAGPLEAVLGSWYVCLQFGSRSTKRRSGIPIGEASTRLNEGTRTGQKVHSSDTGGAVGKTPRPHLTWRAYRLMQ